MGEDVKKFTLKDNLVVLRGLLPEIDVEASELEVRSNMISNFSEEMSSCSRYSFEFIEANGKSLCVPAKPSNFIWTGKALIAIFLIFCLLGPPTELYHLLSIRRIWTQLRGQGVHQEHLIKSRYCVTHEFRYIKGCHRHSDKQMLRVYLASLFVVTPNYSSKPPWSTRVAPWCLLALRLLLTNPQNNHYSYKHRTKRQTRSYKQSRDTHTSGNSGDRTCNEAVTGDMGVDTLQGRRDRNKLKLWCKLAAMPGNRYPKKLFNQEWAFNPRRGRQRKCWSRVVNDLFSTLGLDKAE